MAPVSVLSASFGVAGIRRAAGTVSAEVRLRLALKIACVRAKCPRAHGSAARRILLFYPQRRSAGQLGEHYRIDRHAPTVLKTVVTVDVAVRSDLGEVAIGLSG